MKKIFIIIAAALVFTSCGLKNVEWTANNNSSKNLTVYYSEDSSSIYSLASNESLTINGDTTGSIYASNMPYSVERVISDDNTVNFNDKKLNTYSVLNLSTSYDIKIYYTDETGTSVSSVISKSNNFNSPTIISTYSDKSNFKYYFIDSSNVEVECNSCYLSITSN